MPRRKGKLSSVFHATMSVTHAMLHRRLSGDCCVSHRRLNRHKQQFNPLKLVDVNTRLMLLLLQSPPPLTRVRFVGAACVKQR
jgi:hypothetical protein